MSSFTPYTLGQHAVNVFFVLSGLMLSRSWSLNPDPWRFAGARLLRIYPGLAACGLLVAFVLAPLGTPDSGGHLLNPAFITYPIRVIADFNRAGIDGVFATGSLTPNAINYSLWTIKYELAAYVLFTGAAVLGLAGRPTLAAALLAGSTAAVVALSWHGEDVAPAFVPAGRFLMSFAVGVAAFTFRQRIPIGIHCLAGLLALAVGVRHTPLAIPATILFDGYLALFLGSFTVVRVSAWAQREDLSYGTYLYAWPVQQVLLFRWSGMPLGIHVSASLAGATALAWVSWHGVEAPALRLKRHLGRRAMADRLRRLVEMSRGAFGLTHAMAPDRRWLRLSLGAVGITGCATAALVASCCLAHVSLAGVEFC